MPRRRSKRVLIIVQNLPVPLDRRVWLECNALVSAGIGVSVICPKGSGDPSFEVLNDVRIYKYPPPPQARGALGFLVEFIYCWLMTAVLSLRVWRRDGLDAIQACTPPDTYFALAAFYKLFGKKFVYDQHDLNPELFLSRFGEPQGLAGKAQLAMLRKFESATYRVADHVISTNKSYRGIAMKRGHLDPENVTVVRSGPDTSQMRPVSAVTELKHGREHLVVYLGIMGPQDGVDLVVRAVDVIVNETGREDVHVALLGFGDCLEELKALVAELGLDDYVTFTGRADRKMISEYLSTADVGLCPDPMSPLNDVSTMNKTMEYMAYALPMVSFDLTETRFSAGDASVYVQDDDLHLFVKSLLDLIDDPERRAEMAVEARLRVAAHLDWAPQAAHYVDVYRKVFGMERQPLPDPGQSWPEVDRRRELPVGPLRDEWGHELVDLRGGASLERSIRTRSAVMREQS